MRFRSVLLPHSSGNRGKNSLSHAVVSLFLGSDPSVSNSNMFLLKFDASSKNPCSEFLSTTKHRCVIGILQVVVLGTPLKQPHSRAGGFKK